jgi:hypothetical protein
LKGRAHLNLVASGSCSHLRLHPKLGRDMAALLDPSNRAPWLYKIDFPLFDRASDPRSWLTRCNMFFFGQRTQDSDKTWLASYHLTDVAPCGTTISRQSWTGGRPREM